MVHCKGCDLTFCISHRYEDDHLCPAAEFREKVKTADQEEKDKFLEKLKEKTV